MTTFSLPPPHPARGVAWETKMMTAMKILNGLEILDLTGEEARAAARCGFLEWIFTQPGETTAEHAIRTLADLEAAKAESDAGLAFVGYLQDACMPILSGRGRSGRVKVLH